MSVIYNYFKKLSSENKIGHAYLIGNINYKNIKEELTQVIEDFIFKEQINIDNNPNIYILENDENNITKNQIKELLKKLSTTSQITNKKIYIITKSEKMSDTVYNALLKTIEEPKEGTIAFLITSNLEKIKDTIKSRCTNIFVNEIENKTEDISNLTLKIIKSIEQNKEKTIVKNHEIYNEIADRNLLNTVINEMLITYNKALHILINNNKTEIEIIKIIIKNNTIESIINKIILINKYIEKIEYNLNKNLMIDNIIIELGRCKNETS